MRKEDRLVNLTTPFLGTEHCVGVTGWRGRLGHSPPQCHMGTCCCISLSAVIARFHALLVIKLKSFGEEKKWERCNYQWQFLMSQG